MRSGVGGVAWFGRRGMARSGGEGLGMFGQVTVWTLGETWRGRLFLWRGEVRVACYGELRRGWIIRARQAGLGESRCGVDGPGRVRLGKVWQGWAGLVSLSNLNQTGEITMVYRFRSGATYRGVKAEEAAEELERIRQANGGRLYTAAVVEAAKKKSSPIHDAFTWDDEKAAHQQRMWEARTFLREIVIVGDDEELPAYVHVHIGATEDTRVEMYYQSANVVASVASEYEAAIAACKSRLESAQRSLAELQRIAAKGKKVRVRKAASHVRAAVKEITA